MRQEINCVKNIVSKCCSALGAQTLNDLILSHTTYTLMTQIYISQLDLSSKL